MFSKGKRTKYKFVALENADFYAFIINNVLRLKMDFKEVTSGLGGVQMSLKLEPKTTTFTIPEMEVYKYSEVKKRTVFRLNAYKEYTNEFIVESCGVNRKGYLNDIAKEMKMSSGFTRTGMQDSNTFPLFMLMVSESSGFFTRIM